jgi:hypothetical protein
MFVRESFPKTLAIKFALREQKFAPLFVRQNVKTPKTIVRGPPMQTTVGNASAPGQNPQTVPKKWQRPPAIKTSLTIVENTVGEKQELALRIRAQ